MNNKRGDQYGKLQTDDPPYHNNNSLSWIENDCSSIKNTAVVLTFQHYQWNGTYWTTEEQDQLWSILNSRQDRMVQFQGHSHRFHYTSKDNMPIIIGATASPQPAWSPDNISWIYLVRITSSRMEVVEFEMNTVMTQETPINLDFTRIGIFDLTARPIIPIKQINF